MLLDNIVLREINVKAYTVTSQEGLEGEGSPLRAKRFVPFLGVGKIFHVNGNCDVFKGQKTQNPPGTARVLARPRSL